MNHPLSLHAFNNHSFPSVSTTMCWVTCATWRIFSNYRTDCNSNLNSNSGISRCKTKNNDNINVMHTYIL